jgi:2-haloacid dehalogenase
MNEVHFSDIEACVFDAYGTLFDFNTPLARRRERIGEKADALAELWRRKQLEYSWLRTVMGKHSDFWHVTGEALDFAMESMAIDDPALRADLMQLYLNLEPYPEVKSTLETLKERGLRTAILSNGSPTMLTAVVNYADLRGHFNAVLSIEERGVYKPHPSVYQLAVERLGVGAAHICFLSANGWDVAGAAAFGFQVAWVNRGGAPRERLPYGPTAEITNLEALLPLLV